LCSVCVGNGIKKTFLFYKPTDGIASVQHNHFVEESEINLEICIGVCTDGAQSVSGRDSGLKALKSKEALHVIWT
jgi:hypothetical protein